MAANDQTYQRPMGLFRVLTFFCFLALVFVVVVVNWPALKTQIPSGIIILATQAPTAQATARPTVGTGRQDDRGRTDTGAPALTFDQINATSFAIFRATADAVDAAIPPPNTGQTGEDAQIVVRESNRAAPGEYNVSPESTPVPEDTGHGSKPVGGPINIQETHQCLHGQVWTATGCHRPTPTQ